MTGSSRFSPLDEFSGILADLSQFLSDQKNLGNQTISLSSQSWERMNSWAGPGERIPGFRFQGSDTSPVAIIDSTGRFYEGEAGQLLVKMLEAIKLCPGQAYICTPGSAQLLSQKLRADYTKMIFAFGEKAAQVVTGTRKPLAELQGKPVRFCGIHTMPTYHPEQLIQDPSLKRPVWEAMKLMMAQGD